MGRGRRRGRAGARAAAGPVLVAAGRIRRSSTPTGCAPTTASTRAGWTARPSRSSGCRSSTAPGARSWRRSRCGPTWARARGATRSGSNPACSASRTGRPGGSASRRPNGRRKGRGRPTGSGPSSTFRRSAEARLYVTALGLYEAFLDGHARRRRRTRARLHPVPRAGAVPGVRRHAAGCGRGATCSPSCWPTAGTAARSGCRGRRTSTAATWRCAPSSRCGPSRAGRSWRRASRAGAPRLRTSPRPTSSAASERTAGGSSRRARRGLRRPVVADGRPA